MNLIRLTGHYDDGEALDLWVRPDTIRLIRPDDSGPGALVYLDGNGMVKVDEAAALIAQTVNLFPLAHAAGAPHPASQEPRNGIGQLRPDPIG